MTAQIRKMAREGKIESAPAELVHKYPEIRDRFLATILGHPEAFITDRSKIQDFEFDFESNTDRSYVLCKTFAEFGVDISDCLTAPLAEIFQKIAKETPAEYV